MKTLLFGSRGQLGWQLHRSLSVLGEVVALEASSQPRCGDLLRADAIEATVAAVQPDVVVNAAAYTAVDDAEHDAARAFAVNATACEALARATKAIGAWLVHYSTDYVYDGSGSRPWREDDATVPLGVYGRSKLAGDQAVVRGQPLHLVLRTSWLFDSWGRNFLKTILQAAEERESLQVVADQWGAPTRAALVADVTSHLLRALSAANQPESLAGVYHVAAAGETTWCDYARFALQEAAGHGWPLRAHAGDIRPIASDALPQRAPRPRNCRLDTGRLQHTFGLHLPPWQDGVRAVIAELAARPIHRT